MLTTDSDARKRIPMFSGLLKYFPDALAAVAAHSFVNNEKHNPGQPVHWSREKSSDHMDCVVRHCTDYAQAEALTRRIEEMQACAWRVLAQLQLDIEEFEKLRTTATVQAQHQTAFSIKDRFDGIVTGVPPKVDAA